MKRMIFGTIAILFATVTFSQTADDYMEILRSVLNTEKKAAIAEVMTLTEQEAEVFWPLYNEYNEKLYQLGTKEVKIIKDYAENYTIMTNEKADELWSSYMNVQTEYLKLEKQYYTKFKKILPAGKVVKYFQAENKINALIDAELALEIPIIEVE